MQGAMIWFNIDRGYGFSRTEQNERLYVAHSGFAAGHRPELRCSGLEVRFDRQSAEGDARAVNVSFVTQATPRRARLRHAGAARLH